MLGTGSVFQDSDELISELKKRKKKKTNGSLRTFFLLLGPHPAYLLKVFRDNGFIRRKRN